MKVIYYLIFVLFALGAVACGKGNSKKTPLADTTSIDTAGVVQLEQELKELESKSARIHEKLDSINTTIDQ